MIGLLYVIVGIPYLILLVWATRAAYRWAKSEKLSAAKCWAVAAGGFLLVYLPVFWDHIPTILAKEILCATEAEFTTRKSPEQWKKESRSPVDVPSQPEPAKVTSKDDYFDDGHGRTTTYFLSDRIAWLVIHRDISTFFPIIRIEQQVKDIGKNEVLVRYIDFSTGNSVKNTVGPPGPLKFWLKSGSCRGGDENQSALRAVRDDYLGRTK